MADRSCTSGALLRTSHEIVLSTFVRRIKNTTHEFGQYYFGTCGTSGALLRTSHELVLSKFVRLIFFKGAL